jgi:hypothetical protein
VVIAGLLLVTLLHLVGIGSDYSQLMLVSKAVAGQTIDPSEATANDSRHQFIAALQLLVYIATSLVFLMWLHRVYRNLQALGVLGLKYSPGWAVGGFFVPFLNLVRPFQVVKEIWKASDPKVAPRYSWQDAPTSGLVGWWWALFLISSFLGQLVWRMSAGAHTPASVLNLTNALLASDAFSALASVPAILLVRGVDRRQDEKYRRLTAAGSMAMTAAV